jgi:hypothetical protein
VISLLNKYRFPFIINAIVIIALNFQWLAQVWVVANFYINREEIIAESCVQRNKPKNCCQGSCQLEASLQKVNQSSTEAGTHPTISIQNFEFFSELIPVEVANPAKIQSLIFSASAVKTTIGHFPDISHPPCLS